MTTPIVSSDNLLVLSVIFYGIWIAAMKSRFTHYLMQRLRIREFCVLCVTTWVSFIFLIAERVVLGPVTKSAIITTFVNAFFIGSLTNFMYKVSKKNENNIHF